MYFHLFYALIIVNLDCCPQVTSSDQGNKGVVQGLKVFRDKQICEQMEEKFAETDEKHKKWLTVGPASSEPESSETGKEVCECLVHVGFSATSSLTSAI